MSKPKWTPGPLHVDGCGVKHSADFNMYGCHKVRLENGEPLPDTEANRLLHAAAPDLVEALLAVVLADDRGDFTEGGNPDPVIELCRAALKKAGAL